MTWSILIFFTAVAALIYAINRGLDRWIETNNQIIEDRGGLP